MTSPEAVTLARWDEATWDGPAVVAAPVVDLAQRMDAAQFGGDIRLSLIWRGDIREPTSPYDRWPAPAEDQP